MRKKRDQPSPPTDEPEADADDEQLEDIDKEPLPTMGELYDLTKDQDWAIYQLFPSPGVVMFSGPPSSLKTYILVALGGMLCHGHKWIDGTETKQGLVFYCAGENPDELPIRYRAWLRSVKLPETERVHNSFIAIMASAKQVCRRLVRHLKMIAGRLKISVVIINHTHVKNSAVSQGAFSLRASIDGDFLLVRDEAEDETAATEGLVSERDIVRTLGLRTVVNVGRLKRSRDRGVAYEFVGVPITLGVDTKGRPIESLAMRCLGRTTAAISGTVSLRRYEMASTLLCPSDQSIRSVLTQCNWGGGGNQYDWAREALAPPGTWHTVTIGTGTDARVVRLRLYLKGQWERVAVEAPPEPPKSREEGGDTTSKRADEPEIRERKQQRKGNGRGGGTGSGRPLNSIQRGTMPQEDFDILMETPLAGGGDDSPKQVFEKGIANLRSTGALITDEGERVIAYLAAPRDEPPRPCGG